MGLGFKFTLDQKDRGVSVRARRPDLVLDIDGSAYTVRENVAGDGTVTLEIGGRSYQVWRVWEGDHLHLRIDGRSYSVGYEDAIAAAQHAAGGDDVLRADMPGVVVAVHVETGATVQAGDTVLVIESMKMQVNIVAPRDGIIEAVHVALNENFDKGALLAALKAAD